MQRDGRVGRWAVGLGSGVGTLGEVLEADAGGMAAILFEELTEKMEARSCRAMESNCISLVEG